MRKQPERTARTKQALKDAFWNLYKQKPIEKITIKEITESADVYRSTFYEYFSDSYAVLEEIEQDIMESYKSLVRQVPEVKSLTDGMKLIMPFYSANAEHLAVLLGPNGDPSFLRRIKAEVHIIMQKLFDTPDNDLESDIFIEMVASCVITILTYWYEHQEEFTITEIIQTGSKFLQHGLTPFFQAHGLEFDL